MRWLRRLLTHGVVLGIGFAAGIYALPILIAPDSPQPDEIDQVAQQAAFFGRFTPDLTDSDALHWGDGDVFLSRDSVVLRGSIAPGPDYRLYLSPRFVQTESDFARLKSQMVELGPVRTFQHFLVPVPDGVQLADFNTVIVWCEAFGEFITAAKYQAIHHEGET